MSLAKRVRSILVHPASQALVGLAMMVAGLAELTDSFSAALEPTVAGAHGIVLYGLVNTIKAGLELVEGLEKVDETVEEVRERRSA